MITIARCLSEDYIHSSKLKNFCSSHGMTVSENKPELLRQIIEFAGEDESSEKYVETYDWLLEAIKEGSKEFCLKRVYVPEESIENLEQIISSKYDSSDDIMQMTRIDTASTGNRPLQCSETFFDGKKSILNTKECKNLHLCYNRKRGYLGCFTVQFSVTKGWGVIKTYYVPEEDDIQNVLQTVFENY